MEKIKIRDFSFLYGKDKILENINLNIDSNKITALSGVSGAGKSTLLMCINRLYEDYFNGSVKGSILSFLDNRWVDIYEKSVSIPWLRQKTGMVFQSPNPFPMTIRKNLEFPFKLAGFQRSRSLSVEEEIYSVLEKTGLYHEVKDRMNSSALKLSGGQQQRLCIARSLLSRPEILLLDEPTSSLDEKSQEKIENLLIDLKKECTIVIVSHSKEQIKRVADVGFELSNGVIF